MINGEDEKVRVEKFVEDLFSDAMELRVVLRNEGDANDIKGRITCLKYLNDVAKTYLDLKKAARHDPAAAGSTVRKYATAFAKNATGGGTKGRRGHKPALDANLESDDLGSDTSAA